MKGFLDRKQRSGNQLFNDISMNVGEAEVAASVTEGEPLVIEAKQVEERGVEIVNVDFVFDGLKAEFVGRPVDVAAPNTTARQPHGEPVMIVVAAIDFAGV